MKNDKQIVVMTPASLRTNYLEELKSCGDTLYKKNQYWEFVSGENDTIISTLSSILHLPLDYIQKNKGAWMVNIKKKSNYNELSETDKVSLDTQLNKMITDKYKFYNYNGLRSSHLRDMTQNYSINPFDNKVIIIDEAHNFVSRIVNKMKEPTSLNMKLYEYLLSADNAKLVLLTGTPMINYPNEIGILFNILRGYIKTWHIPIQVKSSKKMNKEEMLNIFEPLQVVDYLDYKPSTKTLVITKNPFGFINVQKNNIYKGVTNFNTKKGGDF